MTAIEFYAEPLAVLATIGGWLAAMVTGLMFSKVVGR